MSEGVQRTVSVLVGVEAAVAGADNEAYAIGLAAPARLPHHGREMALRSWQQQRLNWLHLQLGIAQETVSWDESLKVTVCLLVGNNRFGLSPIALKVAVGIRRRAGVSH